ncbi:MAG: UvrD-helicase domain-containing protein, partial [bacterium]
MTHCLIIQTERLKDAQRAERTLFDFLARLPAGYSLYRELKLTPAYAEQMHGSEQAKPDMVVVGPGIGVLAFEVKDWNLEMNEYEWLDQYRIRVRRRDGHQATISNPADQAERYQRALRTLLGDEDVFVQCFVAFPRLNRNEFVNRFRDLTVLNNPQSRFFLDMDRTVFRDDLSECALHPEELLIRLARKHRSFRGVPAEEIERVNTRLMPTTFCLGNALARQQERTHFHILSNEQQRWAFGIDQDKNYLLDVAGSGKTNTLISRALYLVDRAGSGPVPAILLTTYNTNLEMNIQRILESKIQTAGGDPRRYRDAIIVMGMPALCAELVRTGNSAELCKASSGESPTDYEARLKDWAAATLEEGGSRFARFDHVLIDEIQDFDDTHLYIVTKVCRGGKYFFVGDIGQKIYERSYELKRHGIIKRDIEMEKSYRMYRTPRYIAELATSFVTNDPYVKNEFESHGYTQPVQYVNTSETVAIMAEASDPFDAAAEKVLG